MITVDSLARKSPLVSFQTTGKRWSTLAPATRKAISGLLETAMLKRAENTKRSAKVTMSRRRCVQAIGKNAFRMLLVSIAGAACWAIGKGAFRVLLVSWTRAY